MSDPMKMITLKNLRGDMRVQLHEFTLHMKCGKRTSKAFILTQNAADRDVTIPVPEGLSEREAVYNIDFSFDTERSEFVQKLADAGIPQSVVDSVNLLTGLGQMWIMDIPYSTVIGLNCAWHHVVPNEEAKEGESNWNAVHPSKYFSYFSQ